jgi:methionine-rich copper-binding protein CopC
MSSGLGISGRRECVFNTSLVVALKESIVSSSCRLALWVLVSLLVCAGALTPHSGIAKSELMSSIPAEGDLLDQAPRTVEVRLSEAVMTEGTWLLVVGPDGARVDRGHSTIESMNGGGARVAVSLRADLAEGDYTMHWRAQSDVDDERSFGQVGFTLTSAGATCDAATPVAGECAAPPPEDSIDEPVTVEGMTIALSAASSKAGPIDLTARLTDETGDPIADAQVWVRARHLEMDHGEFPSLMALSEPGTYVAEQVGMGMGGDWRVAVDVIRPGADPVTAFFGIDLEGLS